MDDPTYQKGQIEANLTWHIAPYHWKPGDRVRELAKAGALIAAEIERLFRAISTFANARRTMTSEAKAMTNEELAKRLDDAAAWYESGIYAVAASRLRKLDAVVEALRPLAGLSIRPSTAEHIRVDIIEITGDEPFADHVHNLLTDGVEVARRALQEIEG